MSPRPSSIRARRLVAATAAAVLVAGLAACSGDADVDSGGEPDDVESSATAAESTGTDASEPSEPDPALARYYDQELDWGPCRGAGEIEGDLECTQLLVPLDYESPEEEEIPLLVLRVKATGEAQGSLVVNPGGPGGSGVQFAAGAGELLSDDLTANLDVVGFDPRGVAGSAPLDCVTDDQLDAFRNLDATPDDERELDSLVAGTEQFNAGCAEKSGALAQHVSTQEVARDLDVLRAALGDDQLTYYGASYGTAIGATYAELFPDRAGRLVLDGAVDLELTPVEKSVAQAGGFETALRSFLDACVAEPDCPLGSNADQAARAIGTLLTTIDEKPIRGEPGRPLTSGLAVSGIITPLYTQEQWPALAKALVLAAKGDGRGLLALADQQAGRVDGGYADNSAEALTAINCLDDPRTATPDQVPDLVDDYTEAAPTIGPWLTYSAMTCLGTEVEPVEPLDVDGSGAAPIVVVGTTRDPATPYAWAEALADELESGLLVTREGDGHVAYTSGNPCIVTAVDAFLVEGTVPDDGLTCADE